MKIIRRLLVLAFIIILVVIFMPQGAMDKINSLTGAVISEAGQDYSKQRETYNTLVYGAKVVVNCDTTKDKDCYDQLSKYKRECADVRFNLRTPEGDFDYIFGLDDETCKVEMKIKKGFSPSIDGSKINCELPVDKLDWFSTASERDFLEYCVRNYN